MSYFSDLLFPKYSQQLTKLQTELADIKKRGGLNVPGELLNALFDEGHNRVKVDTETCTTLASVYQAINILANSINIPVTVFKRKKNGDPEPVTKSNPYEYQVYRLLHVSPNLMHTPSDWFSLMEMSCYIYGNGYAYIVRNQLREPIALRWFHHNNVEVKSSGVELTYKLKLDNGDTYKDNVSSLDMIHRKSMSFDGIMGRSPIDVAKDSLEFGLQTQKSGNNFFRSGMRQSFLLSHPGKMPAEVSDRLRTQFQQQLAANKVIVTEDDMKVNVLSFSPEQSQFLTSREFSVTEVARWFNLPEHMLNNNQRATFSNIESQFLQFTQMNVRPRVRAWEQELNWKLLGNNPDFYVEFNMDALIRSDLASQAQYFMTAIQNGWMTRNEVRKLKNMPKITGGDDALTPMNLMTDAEREEKMNYESSKEKENDSTVPTEEE
jgi:HK97 family phage portal protein